MFSVSGDFDVFHSDDNHLTYFLHVRVCVRVCVCMCVCVYVLYVCMCLYNKHSHVLNVIIEADVYTQSTVLRPHMSRQL